MQTLYTFTLNQLVTGFLAICAAIVSISAAVNVILKAIAKVKEPDTKQNGRLDRHDEEIKWVKSRILDLSKDVEEINNIKYNIDLIEKELEDHESFLKADKGHLTKIDESNKITQRALLALLSHALDGNSIQPMKEAKKVLEDYLINK